ncbi:response regulator [bacterium]|jgi:CheY-like chemotaxis protein|nr:response regulator [bacterium]
MKILFIDEEAPLVDIYCDFFKKKGWNFLTTYNIPKAIEISKIEKPDVVLLDLIIPLPENVIAEQGYDFLKQIKANPETKNIPIIVFSNLDTPKDRQKCKDLGASAFVFKRDCSPKEVLETINEVIKRTKS